MRRETGVPSRALRDSGLCGLLERLDVAGVLAVIVFGSVARGEANDRSDLDVLVVVENDETRAAALQGLSEKDADLTSPIVLTRDALVGGLSTRPSFIAHLLDEGVIVYEIPAWRDVEASLATSVSNAERLAAEVRQRVKEVGPLAHPERFANSPVTAMSHLYGVARALVIARLLQCGIHEYSWRVVFDRYAELRPELKSDLEALKALRPYFECARARPGTVLPTQAVVAEDLPRLVASIERLAA